MNVVRKVRVTLLAFYAGAFLLANAQGASFTDEHNDGSLSDWTGYGR